MNEQKGTLLVDLIRRDPEKAEIFMGELIDTFQTHMKMMAALEKMMNRVENGECDTYVAYREYLVDISKAAKLHGK